MKKKYKALTILAVAIMLVSIITISTASISAEQGNITLEYHHTDPSANGGTQGDTDHNPNTTQGSNTPGINQSNEHTQSNVKTGDSTVSIVCGLTVTVLLSASIAWFAFKKRKQIDTDQA